MTDTATAIAAALQPRDAAAHLEELLGRSAREPIAGHEHAGASRFVEVVGPHLRVRGRLRLGHYRRLTDMVNSREGLLRITDAVVLGADDEPGRVLVPDLWVAQSEMTLIADLDGAHAPGASPDMHIAKESSGLVLVTPGHLVTGSVHIPTGADLAVFIESPAPAFVPMTEVDARSLAGTGRVRAQYLFALVNRRHLVAVTAMPGLADEVSWLP